MSEPALDLAADLLVTLLSAVGAVAFTGVGILVDRSGLDLVLSGSTATGAWELWMGSLAIFVGAYLLGYRTAWPALASRR